MKMLVTFRTQIPMGLDMALGIGHAVRCSELEYDNDVLVLDKQQFINVFRFKIQLVEEEDGGPKVP